VENEQKADNWMELGLRRGDRGRRLHRDRQRTDRHPRGLYEGGFKQAAIHGEEALEDTDLDDDEIESIVETARENVSVPYVNVTGYVDLSNPTDTPASTGSARHSKRPKATARSPKRSISR